MTVRTFLTILRIARRINPLSFYLEVLVVTAVNITLIKLYDILSKLPGVYGTRFSGAGFKGCCMALIDPSYSESICEAVQKEYLAEFPMLAGKYAAFICDTADGVGSASGDRF